MLATSVRVLGTGMGTFGSDHVTPDEVAAAELGYQHPDCATVYDNEAQIVGIFKRILSPNTGI